MLIKTPLLHQSFGPRVFLSFFPSLFLSLYFWLIPWSVEARWAHFLAQAFKTLSRSCTVPSPTREGAQCLRAAVWALRTLLAFRVNQGISASFSLLLSEPPGSGPLKDQQVVSQELISAIKRSCLHFLTMCPPYAAHKRDACFLPGQQGSLSLTPVPPPDSTVLTIPSPLVT